MEMLLSFVAGLVLAGIVAFFMLRSVKSSAADALTKALDDAAKQAETEKKAAIATLEADLKNAKDNLEQAKSDAEKHTQELLSAKDEAHEKAIEGDCSYREASHGSDGGDGETSCRSYRSRAQAL